MKNEQLSKRIPLEGTINTRDLGGYPASDGRHIKYKRLIRTDRLSSLTEKDIAFLVQNYQPKYDIDLRRKGEIKIHPDKPIPGCVYINDPVSEEMDKRGKEHPHPNYETNDIDINGLIHYLYTISPNGDSRTAMENSYRRYIESDFSQKAIAKFFRILIQNKEGSILYHCSDGKDRAGMMTALVLLTLGVSKNDVLYDYLKTNENTKGKRDFRDHYLHEVIKLPNELLIQSILLVAGVSQNWFEAAYQAIQDFGGIQKYMREQIKLTDEEIEALKANYLE